MSTTSNTVAALNCARKRKFRTKEEADNIAAYWNSKRPDELPQTSHHCGVCMHWHIGHDRIRKFRR